jgi:nitrous oxide reductase accessory protein NosL
MAIEYVTQNLNVPFGATTVSTCTACGALVSDSPTPLGPGEFTAHQLHENWHAVIDQIMARTEQPY